MSSLRPTVLQKNPCNWWTTIPYVLLHPPDHGRIRLDFALDSFSNSWLRCLNLPKILDQYGSPINDVWPSSISISSADFDTLSMTLTVTHDGEDAEMSIPEEDSKKEYPCLIRVTDGKHTQFSTKVRRVSDRPTIDDLLRIACHITLSR